MQDKNLIPLAIQAITNCNRESQPPEVQNMVDLFQRVEKEHTTQLRSLVTNLLRMFKDVGVKDTEHHMRLLANSSHQQIMSYIAVSNDTLPNAWTDKFLFNASVLALFQSFEPDSILKKAKRQEGASTFSDPRWASFVAERIVQSNREVLNSGLAIA
jgi:hypothetical protein